ncbi:cytochrome P450, partial [Pisolithus marmoratus]
VVGDPCLPEFRDREKLPYIEAVLLETLRWYPIGPLHDLTDTRPVLPHMSRMADAFQGMAMTWNETCYPNPSAFDPRRHLTASGMLAEGTSSQYFGLGRCICPGRHIADQSLWAVIVSILATLCIGKARNEAGHEVNFTPEFTKGLST